MKQYLNNISNILTFLIIVLILKVFYNSYIRPKNVKKKHILGFKVLPIPKFLHKITKIYGKNGRSGTETKLDMWSVSHFLFFSNV